VCLRALVVLGVALASALSLASTVQAASGRATLASMGMVYKGLKHVAHGPCGFDYQIAMRGPARCTHGPDPAPPGVDVRQRRSLTDLALSLPPRALFAGSPTMSLVPCIGDGKSGARVQAVYAHPPGTADRYGQIAPMIKTWASQVDETYSRSAAETGGMRHIRFVTANCDLSVLDVVARADSVNHTFADLVANGLTPTNRKYLVWMDANEICGIGESYDDSRPGQFNKNNGPPGIPAMMARIDEGCWGEYTNLARGSTEAHELTHTFGAVLGSAPHATGYGHCWDAYDVMCYEDGPGTVLQNLCPFSHEVLLDCNHDDYFNTSPAPGTLLYTHWNTANSQFLDGGGASPDTAAPVVHAQATSVKRKKVVKLRFDVTDDSGQVSVQLAVFRGQKQLKKWVPESLANGSWYVSWTAPAKAQTLNFCAAAQDVSGNQSCTVCAKLKVT
jgi:hypothetical protein